MRSLLASLFLLMGSISLAQVGIGTTNPSDAAMLEVSSSTDGTNFKGFMPPRVSSIAERTTINPGVDDVGLLIFLADATNGNYCLQIWGGTAWEDVYCLSSPVIGSEVYYTVSSQTLSEGSGRVDLEFTIDNPSPTDAITVTIDADDYTDLIETTAQTVIIPAGATAHTAAVFSIDDDSTVEAAEDVEFTISTISGGLGTATIGTPSVHTLTILDDDGTSALPYTESFETDGAGVRYALSESQAIDAGDDDYFSRARLSDFPYTGNNTVSFLGSPDGDYFFAAQDIDGVPGYSSATQTLTITGIDITGGINLEMDVLLAEDDDATNQDWDSGDLVTFEYQIDGGGYQNLLQIASTGGTNSEPAIDTDFDGVGDGTVLTETWADFNASITGTGSTLDIRITFTLNADDEDIAIDNIRITSN